MVPRPESAEYASFYAGYVARVPEGDILQVLEAQPRELSAALAPVVDAREKYRYAEGKWSIRELLGHINDAERVFGFRAFCFSRSDSSELPPFDEGAYVVQGRHDEVPVSEHLREFGSLRAANLAFLMRLRDDDWLRTGVANRSTVSVRALAWILGGHLRHHLTVLRERYL